MKWATGFVLAAGLFQRHARADDLHDIRARYEFVEKRVRNSAGHGPPPTRGILGQALKLSAQFGFDLRPDCAHVGTALRLGLDHGHDLAHVLDAGGAGGGNGIVDQGIEFRGAQL